MSAIIVPFQKDPDDLLDFGVDWRSEGWLGEDESIVSSEWFAPEGITVEAEQNDDGTATIWISDGELGETYPLVNRIVTDSDPVQRRKDQTILILIQKS